MRPTLQLVVTVLLQARPSLSLLVDSVWPHPRGLRSWLSCTHISLCTACSLPLSSPCEAGAGPLAALVTDSPPEGIQPRKPLVEPGPVLRSMAAVLAEGRWSSAQVGGGTPLLWRGIPWSGCVGPQRRESWALAHPTRLAETASCSHLLLSFS